MKRFFTSIALILVIAGGAFLTQNAQAGQFGMQNQMGFSNSARMGRGGFGSQNFMIIRQLNLTQSQISMMRALRQQQRMAQLRSFGNYRNPMFEAMKSGKFNKKAFESAYMTNYRKTAQLRAHYMQGFLSILTPAQKQKFYALMKNRMRMRLGTMKLQEQSLKMRMNHLKTLIKR